MVILPAIDLRGGRCVRLRQGRYDDETVFSDDPVAVARQFEAEGARWLHVVDLDGARRGEPAETARIRDMTSAVGMKVEVGGGLRSAEAVDELLGAGVARVIVGTRAVEDPEWFRRLVEARPGRVALGLDARDGRVAVDGWEQETTLEAASVVEMFAELEIAAVIYTDIRRDGMMAGPNVEATAALVGASPWPVVASGGVTTVEDVRRVADGGCAGAIIGRALYEGKITLAEALAAAGDA